MEGQEQLSEAVIHFDCGHCRISLTVDDSLAGVTGPCPSCGEAITAPVPSLPQNIEIKPRSFSRRENLGKEASNAKPSGKPVSSSPSTRSKGRRAVSPNTGLSEAHKEKVEVATVIKMLIAGLLVLGVVLVVAYLLNSQF